MDDLPELLRDASEDAPPARLDLAATIRRGTQLRRRRTALRAAGSVVALAAVVGVGISGMNALRPAVGTAPVAGPAPASIPASSPTPTPTPTPTTRTPPTKEEPAALGDWIRPRLLAMLEPHGTTTIVEEWSNDTFYRFNVTVDDGKGAALMVFIVERDPRDPAARGPLLRRCSPGDPDIPEGASCTALADGSILWTAKTTGYATKDPRHKGENGNHAMLTRPDNTRISLVAANGLGEKSAPTRTNPVLTLDQVKAVVTAKVWDDMPLPD